MADETTTTLIDVPKLAPPGRDDIRAAIFRTKEIKQKEVDFFGVKIELRQPSLASALTKHDGDEPKLAIIGNLIDCAYVPGTNQKVFDAADYDALVELPFGEDYIRITQAIGEITGTNLLATAGSSAKGQTST